MCLDQSIKPIDLLRPDLAFLCLELNEHEPAPFHRYEVRESRVGSPAVIGVIAQPALPLHLFDHCRLQFGFFHVALSIEEGACLRNATSTDQAPTFHSASNCGSMSSSVCLKACHWRREISQRKFSSSRFCFTFDQLNTLRFVTMISRARA